MSDRIFVDTNILVYAHDLSAGDRHAKAAAVIKSLWEAETGVISTQVLQEFYVTVTHKIKNPLITSPGPYRSMIRRRQYGLLKSKKRTVSLFGTR